MHRAHRYCIRRPKYQTNRAFRLPPAAAAPTGSVCRQGDEESRASNSSTTVRESCPLATEKRRWWRALCTVHSLFVFPPRPVTVLVVLRLILNSIPPFRSSASTLSVMVHLSP